MCRRFFSTWSKGGGLKGYVGGWLRGCVSGGRLGECVILCYAGDGSWLGWV